MIESILQDLADRHSKKTGDALSDQMYGQMVEEFNRVLEHPALNS
jgi:hypothetical protein